MSFLTDNSILLFAAIILGVVIQQVLTWLTQHDKKIAYAILSPVAIIYWIVLGVAMIARATQSTLNNIGGIALGVGLILSGLGQTFEKSWLRTIGVIVMSVGPVISGVGLIQSGNSLGGMISLTLGLGILVSVVQGWPGGIGQMVIGAVIIGSSAMLLINIWMTSTTQVNGVVIGVVMLALGLWSITNGGITVIGTIKESSAATLPSD